MLARAHRVVSGDDYRRIVRSGRRSTTPHTVIYRRINGGGETRFGFIVSKAVGNAVIRNRVRRRLKAIALGLIVEVTPGTEIVVRALPGCAEASWVTLNAEITDTLSKGKTRV